VFPTGGGISAFWFTPQRLPILGKTSDASAWDDLGASLKETITW